MNKLEMRHIDKSFYGVRVLHNVNLTVKKGSIHALIGENGAGKSTLMNILGGVYTLETGTIKLDDIEVENLNVKKSESLGVAFVHQEINLFNDLTAYENIFINKEILHGKTLLNRKEMIKKSNQLFNDLGVKINAEDVVENLSTCQKQLLEICKSLFSNADLFILDEPTTALNNEEIDNFFQIIKKLQKSGKTFIFISHKMPEIFKICDEYTVLRNGRVVANGKIKDTDPEIITKEIVGASYQNKEVYVKRDIKELLLEIKNYTGEGFADVNLKIYKGEIIGFTGLQGAGSSELMQTLFGINKSFNGEVVLKGIDITNRSIKYVMNKGVGMVPANRKENSVFQNQDLIENLLLASYSVQKNPFINSKKEDLTYQKYKKDLSIKANNPKDLIVSLSGGNQQKVIIGRWLDTNADVLLLDNPTQGIDVGAKSEIYKLLIDLANNGKTIIFNTLEIPEIQKCADRCCVFYHGTIEKILNRNEINEQTVMMYATKAKKIGGKENE